MKNRLKTTERIEDAAFEETTKGYVLDLGACVCWGVKLNCD